MANDPFPIPLGELQAACQFIMTQWADDMKRGGDIELGYVMCRNRLQGFFLLAAGTVGERIVKHAQDALDAEYRRLKAGQILAAPGQRGAVPENAR
ncbi:hypothetical protein [Methylocaldum sp.]|uniref:hypothetical protein n=1 Tax=Methylocaldum sp. TaxID=1969727 RepID=UPI002D328FCB|nr:hypothetical protein [Methylocaldum sp.]HYE37265.1 hypothetical protein [Methylocaldum sp.]